jgi:hypothetical protein
VEVQSHGVGGTHRDALITKCGNAPPTIELPEQKKSDSESSNVSAQSFGGWQDDSFIQAVHSCERARCVVHFFKEISRLESPFLASVKSKPTDR